VHARSHAHTGHAAPDERPSRPRPGTEPGVGVAALLAAVRAVPGVSDAQVRTSADGDRTLRLDLVEGADPATVAAEVSAVLEDRLGLLADPSRVVTGSDGGAGSDRMVGAISVPIGAPPRSVLAGRVQVTTSGLDATAQVTLRAGERDVTGIATGPAVEDAILRTVATATLQAVDQLLDGRARCGLDSAVVTEAGADRIAVTVVTLLTEAGSNRIAGAALIRGDARQAMARAVLGSLNRRLDGFFSGVATAPGDAETVSPVQNRERETR
jgi:hypothetical protein